MSASCSALASPRRRSCILSSSPSRSEEHTSELQSRQYLVCRLLLEKKKNTRNLIYGNISQPTSKCPLCLLYYHLSVSLPSLLVDRLLILWSRSSGRRCPVS